MAKYRQNRINDAVKEEMAQILRDVKDPRISGALVSITAADVAAEIKKQFGIEVDKKKVSLEGDIKTYGTFNAEVKFGHSVSAKIFVLVSE